MEFYHKDKKNLEAYIKLGAKGFYPLFPKELINTYLKDNKINKLNAAEKIKAKSLLKKVCEYKTNKKRKVIIETLNTTDREIFLKAFMNLIESSILDESPYLH